MTQPVYSTHASEDIFFIAKTREANNGNANGIVLWSENLVRN